jgi:GH43 family beta-xylosidase
MIVPDTAAMLPHRTYTNPVFLKDAADPFVLKHLDAYWCYCTGSASNGFRFPILSSTDLVRWNDEGGALFPLQQDYREYWAPEVTYWDGKFFMYYSAGDGSEMHIRVAIANTPAGPFLDIGKRLTVGEFAIDPHVFTDDDGLRWLFYATDFLEHSHIGTGTVRDRLLDSVTLEGNPVPVVRAMYSWQLFDPERREKGGVRWHTVEGPTVLKNKGVYYEMFSGGNWKNASYGVGYAFSDKVDRLDEWTQVCDGTRVLPLLRTVPGVTGPGHNSVVYGPDNRQRYCVYHRWSEDGAARHLAIDALEWIGPELCVYGPSNSPQAAPNLARSLLRAASEGELPADWHHHSGQWQTIENKAQQSSPDGFTEARPSIVLGTGFLLECGVRLLTPTPYARSGVSTLGLEGDRVLAILSPQGDLSLSKDNESLAESIDQSSTESSALSILHLEVTGRLLSASTDRPGSLQRVILRSVPDSIALFTQRTAAEFGGLSLTRGWKDAFDYPSATVSELGWKPEIGIWKIESMQLYHHGESTNGTIFKAVPPGPYEFVINARLKKSGGGCYGFFPASSETEPGPLVRLISRSNGWALGLDRGGAAAEGATVLAELPSSFAVHEYQQFGFTLQNGSVSIRWRGQVLCDTALNNFGERVGLFAAGNAAFDMVRVTELLD